MRFGSHSHDPDLQNLDATTTAKRASVVRTLRDLADQIERSPVERLSESLAWITATIAAVVRAVDHALGVQR